MSAVLISGARQSDTPIYVGSARTAPQIAPRFVHNHVDQAIYHDVKCSPRPSARPRPWGCTVRARRRPFPELPLHSGVCAARDRSHFRVSRMHGAWSDNFVRRRRTAVDATIPLRARCAATPLGEQHRQSEFAERGGLRYILRAPNPAQFLISSEFHIRI